MYIINKLKNLFINKNNNKQYLGIKSNELERMSYFYHLYL